MRGEGDVRTAALFSYVSCEARVPLEHPLGPLRSVVDAALVDLSPAFERLYAPIGPPSIAPEKLLRALLLQAFFSIRSERQLMEQLDDNLLLRWFTGLGIDDPVGDHRAPLGDRRPHDAPSRLCGQSARPQADRGEL